MTNAEVVAAIEEVAPLALQEDWDNSGWQIKPADDDCSGVMICVDVTPEVIVEAHKRGCNLVVSHHPLLFNGLKRIGNDTTSTVVRQAIVWGIGVYSSHTSLDNSPVGVSRRMAQMLGLSDVTALQPMAQSMMKLRVYVPESHAESVRQSIAVAGAGRMGDYDSCSFTCPGIGRFRPLRGASPFIGVPDQLEAVEEVCIEALVNKSDRDKVLKAMFDAHPYECPAWEFVAIESTPSEAGLGAVGMLNKPMDENEFVEHVKRAFGIMHLRCSAGRGGTICRVALCGGSGASLIRSAVSSGADAYVTGDLKYHDYTEYGSGIMLVDAGHFETERCATLIIKEAIDRKKITNFVAEIAQSATNPSVIR